MTLRHRLCVDVHLILRDRDNVLLAQRRGTGFADGFYHPPAGHLEAGESATAGLAREAQEEIGVAIQPGKVRLVHVMHHRTNEPRLALFYEVTEWVGDPTNREPLKCSDLRWFNIRSLPEKITPYAREALRRLTEGELYSERGWSEEGTSS